MAEVRTMSEGELRWVRASGVGNVWATAATPVSGIFAFVRSFSYTSAQTVTTVNERGRPHHNKITQVAPIDVTMTCAWTGRFPSAVSGSGATVPMIHLEHRASAAEIGNGTTGDFTQFHGVALASIQFTEGAEENTLNVSFRALAMNGPTGSGYLS